MSDFTGAPPGELKRTEKSTPFLGKNSEDQSQQQDEIGWLIEYRSVGNAPTYWAGKKDFTYNHMEAVRFARKEDAERVMRSSGQMVFAVKNLFAVEHMWCPRTSPIPERTILGLLRLIGWQSGRDRELTEEEADLILEVGANHSVTDEERVRLRGRVLGRTFGAIPDKEPPVGITDGRRTVYPGEPPQERASLTERSIRTIDLPSAVIQRVVELEYTPPEDFPENMVMCTTEELRAIVEEEASGFALPTLAETEVRAILSYIATLKGWLSFACPPGK